MMKSAARQWLAIGLGAFGLAQAVATGSPADPAGPRYRVMTFAGPTGDQAHVSFVTEARRWFGELATERHFALRISTNWAELNADELKGEDVVVFLNARPEAAAARSALQRYLEQGGAWMGFHFAAFALTPSAVPQDWDWYHVGLLGAGSYAGNTWKPTAAVLRVEAPDHPVMAGVPGSFKSAPNEWYKWTGDLRHNPAIQVLVAIDPVSFPLGTGPKAHEIWHEGDYPVVWTHRRFRMVYFNMGHDDMDYDQRPARARSSSFSSPEQNRMVLNALEWLGTGGRREPSRRRRRRDVRL